MKFIFAVIFLVSAISACALAAPPQQQGQDTEDVMDQLANQLAHRARMSLFAFNGLRELPYLLSQNVNKRNSEMINSLLGLPKVMNDAGRRK